MSKIAFLFDGQGAFRPGVGKELYHTYNEAKNIIDTGSDVLGLDLKEWLWGDKAKETAGRTSIAQPAISTVSLAYAAILKNRNVMSEISLGHSLGEVTAIVHSGILSTEDGLKVIKKRGELMEREGKEGTMMAVINVDPKKLQKFCTTASEETKEHVVIANINAPQQIVISGGKTAIQSVAKLVIGIHGRGIPLKVGGAWHSPYLNDAAKEFSGFLDTISFQKPTTKFFSVIDQRVVDDPEAVKASLKEQMLAKVDWVGAIQKVSGLGYNKFLEIGPSKILKDLTLKTDNSLHCESTALFADMDVLVQNL